jgi:hypothetical protein
MPSDTPGDRMRSLGDLIAALRPGDDCPWCGARLQCVSALKQVSGTSTRTEGKSGVRDPQEIMLVCRECGSEVCAAGEFEHTHGHRALGTAA